MTPRKKKLAQDQKKIKLTVFKTTPEQINIIEKLTDKLQFMSKSECVRQVLFQRAEQEGIKIK